MSRINPKYLVQGYIPKSEAIKMLDELEVVCKKHIREKRILSISRHKFISWAIRHHKECLVSKRIKRMYVLKLIHTQFAEASAFIGERSWMAFERAYGEVIQKRGYSMYELMCGTTKDNWLDSSKNPKINLHYIPFRTKTMKWGNRV